MDSLDSVIHKYPGMHLYNGVLMSTVFTPQSLQDAITFNFDPSDILVASYPKSGSTWLREIIWLITNNFDLDTAKTTRLNDRSLFLESSKPGSDHGDHHPKPPPRLIYSHLPYGFLKKTIEGSLGESQGETQGESLNTIEGSLGESQGEPQGESLKTGDIPKVVVVMRNPKDVLVSQFHFYKMNKRLGCFSGSWDTFFDMFKNRELHCGYWLDHVQSWWEQKKKANYMFMKYEDMKKDPSGGCSKLVEFLGRSCSEQQLEQLVAHTGFDSMKTNKMVNNEEWQILNNSKSAFMRKGVVGDWKNYFSEEQSDFVDDLCKGLLEQGLHFDFE